MLNPYSKTLLWSSVLYVKPEKSFWLGFMVILVRWCGLGGSWKFWWVDSVLYYLGSHINNSSRTTQFILKLHFLKNSCSGINVGVWLIGKLCGLAEKRPTCFPLPFMNAKDTSHQLFVNARSFPPTVNMVVWFSWVKEVLVGGWYFVLFGIILDHISIDREVWQNFVCQEIAFPQK